MQPRITLLLGLALMAVTTWAAPAQADVLEVEDRAGDVWEAHYSDDAGLVGYTKAGPRWNTDIVETVVRHGPKRLGLVMQYTDLRPDRLWFSTRHDLRVEGLDSVVHVGVSADRRWRGDTSVDTAENGMVTELTCDRLGHEIDYRNDRVRFWIARGCLDGPAWIQVASFSGSERMADNRYFRDVYDSGRHAPPPWSPRVYPG